MLNNNADISFVIPIHNNSLDDLKRCLKSIFMIRNLNYEVIIVSNSSKKSLNLQYKALVKHENSQNLHFITISKRGVSNARNIGINFAKGNFISFVDADDMIEASSYNKLNLSENVDVYIMNILIKSSRGNQLLRIDNLGNKNLINKKTLVYNVVTSFKLNNAVSKLFNRSFLMNNSIFFDTGLKSGEDLKFMCQTILKSKNVYFFDTVGYYYNQSAMTAIERSRKYPLTIFENSIKVFKLKKRMLLELHDDVLLPHVQSEYIREITSIYLDLLYENSSEAICTKKRIISQVNRFKLNPKYKLEINLRILIFKHFKWPIYLMYFLRKKRILRENCDS